METPPSTTPPSRPLPKWAKKACFSVLETYKIRKFQRILEKNAKLAPFMLNFCIHQCCANDRFEIVQKLLDASTEMDRESIVNIPFGRKGYRPIHRAAFAGSLQVFKFLLCCGAEPVDSPEGESIPTILQQGLKNETSQAGYTLAKVVHYSPKSLFYTVELPNKTRGQYSSAIVDHRKYTRPGHVYVPTPDTKSNVIFVQERFRKMHEFLRLRNEAKQKRAPARRTKKMIPKQVAALRIQRWWKGAGEDNTKKVEEPSSSPLELFRAKGALPCEEGSKAFLLELIENGRHADFQAFLSHKASSRLLHVLKGDEALSSLAMDDCPILLKERW